MTEDMDLETNNEIVEEIKEDIKKETTDLKKELEMEIQEVSFMMIDYRQEAAWIGNPFTNPIIPMIDTEDIHKSNKVKII